MSIARPAAAMLRRPLVSELKKHVVIATVLSVGVAVAWKVLVSDWRRKQYAEFYKYKSKTKKNNTRLFFFN